MADRAGGAAERLSRFGARLGNWNDRKNATGDRRAEHPRRWHLLDRIAMWLYVMPDRRRRAEDR